ncbi:histidinol-phosphatase HisJ [Alkaliphilus peptidifermentans]|uniref:Histidinol-phosphatase n=1 Tax=Alkaliphilus peptidifermentans DSM 18978 TaxID=1120976 RepID=A0A1G5GZ52_9FIRM|nr:histidinol-phosphatase HisJ [Alkaliphilus peptidifermentans]SCY56701.1 histidinol-phosphatase (PHP family) [Alkaliphilus peptidifermentans DSM 18978]
MDNCRILRDGHIHSPYCPHGTKDPFELYIENSLKLGLKEITFTEHMPLPGNFMEPEFLKECAPSQDVIENYIKELESIKDKYKFDIKINIGFEVDFIEGYEAIIKDTLNRYGDKIEDSILSVHFIKVEDEYYCVDVSPDEFGKIVKKLGSVEKVYDSYYETLLKAIKADLGLYKPKRIGHPTLIRIFNTEYPFEYKNRRLLEAIVKEMKINNYEVDFNTAGIRKPYCKEPYPSGILAELVEAYGINIVFGSDAHTALDVGRDFIKYAGELE